MDWLLAALHQMDSDRPSDSSSFPVKYLQNSPKTSQKKYLNYNVHNKQLKWEIVYRYK